MRSWSGFGRFGGFALAAIGLGFLVVLSARVVVTSVAWGTTSAGVSPAATAADICAGVALMVAGLFIAWEGPRWRRGALIALGGVIWFASDWVGWQTGNPMVRSVATVLQPLFAVVLLHVVAITPGARVVSRFERWIVVSAYLATGVLSVSLAAVYDPLADPSCWRNCTDNTLIVWHSADAAVRLSWLLAAAGLVTGLLLLGTCLGRLVATSAATRHIQWPVMVPGAVIATTVVIHAGALLAGPVEQPQDPLYASLFLVLAWSVVAFGSGLAWLCLRSRLNRRGILDLVAGLGANPAPGSLTSVLSRAIGDPRLRIAYRLQGPERWVESDGRVTGLTPPDPHLVATRVIQDHEVVALVWHDPEIADPAQLERQIGPAARLALENERLQADVLARLAELKRSRARIVSSGDAERRQIERDLHDGAQQQLLALTYDLRVAHSEAVREGAIEAATILEGALRDTRAAHEQLRELAHGIYPQILVQAGLAAALQTLADRVPLHMSLNDFPEGSDGAGTAAGATAYVVVEEAIRDAALRQATVARVSIREMDGQTVVRVEDDGSARHGVPIYVADRVGAAGGIVTRESVNDQYTVMEARIPCG